MTHAAIYFPTIRSSVVSQTTGWDHEEVSHSAVILTWKIDFVFPASIATYSVVNVLVIIFHVFSMKFHDLILHDFSMTWQQNRVAPLPRLGITLLVDPFLILAIKLLVLGKSIILRGHVPRICKARGSSSQLSSVRSSTF